MGREVSRLRYEIIDAAEGSRNRADGTHEGADFR